MIKHLLLVFACLLPLASLSSDPKPIEESPPIIPENVELPDTVEQSKEDEPAPTGYGEGAKSSIASYGDTSSGASPPTSPIAPSLGTAPSSGSMEVDADALLKVPYQTKISPFSTTSSPSSSSSSGSLFSHIVPEASPLESMIVSSCGKGQFKEPKLLFTSSFSVAYLTSNVETGEVVLRKDILIDPTEELQEYEKQHLISESSRFVPKVICVDNDPAEHSFEMQQSGKMERVKAWPGKLDTLGSLRKVSVYMEYASKGDLHAILTTWIKQDTPMTDAQRTQVRLWLRQAVQAVRSVHAAGWLHLDVKVENFVVDEHDDLKIIDFGFSLPLIKGEGRNRMDRPRGTRLYGAPEVWDHDWLYRATDYHSLGALIFVMHELGTPSSMRTARFTARTPPEVRELIVNLTSPIFQVREETFSAIFQHSLFQNIGPKPAVVVTKKEKEDDVVVV